MGHRRGSDGIRAHRAYLVATVVTAAIVGAAFVASGFFGAIHADAAGMRGSERLAGADRLATAVAISRHQFPEGAATVYLAAADRPVAHSRADRLREAQCC